MTPPHPDDFVRAALSAWGNEPTGATPPTAFSSLVEHLSDAAQAYHLMATNPRLRTPQRYMHNCTSCIPLGQWINYDLYVCTRVPAPTITTPHPGYFMVHARYGSDPSSVVTGNGPACENTVCLAVAFERALALGYLPADTTFYPGGEPD